MKHEWPSDCGRLGVLEGRVGNENYNEELYYIVLYVTPMEEEKEEGMGQGESRMEMQSQ